MQFLYLFLSGRRSNVASNRKLRVSVLNYQAVIRQGPMPRRLAWESATPVALLEPVSSPREQDVWEEVCTATSYVSGQLEGEAGTAENPHFACEDAIVYRKAKADLQLVAGGRIPTEDNTIMTPATADLQLVAGGRIPTEVNTIMTPATSGNIRQQREEMKESWLSLLPKGVVPPRWHVWGRPWALMDCP